MERNLWGVTGLVIFAAAATAIAAATVPDGAALRIKGFTPAGAGIVENPNADGMAKLKFYDDPVDGPSIRAHVHLYDFLPGTTYGVDVETDQGGGDFADIVTTNAAGNRNVVFHFAIAGAPADAVILVYRDTINSDSWDVGEERAAISAASGDSRSGHAAANNANSASPTKAFRRGRFWTPSRACVAFALPG